MTDLDKPEPDEVRMQHLLRSRGVGPDAEPPPMPPGPPPAGFDPEPAPEAWWSTEPKADEPGEDDSEDQPEAARPRVFVVQPDYWPQPHLPAAVHGIRDRAPAALSPRTRAGLYNASAAGAGWGLGLYDQFASALRDCGQTEGTGAALVLGIAASLLIAHVWDRRTRHWWPGIAWAARIPLATALLALALWAPAAT